MVTNGTCGKCSGRGRIVGFSHIDNGRCFDCGGSGKHEHTPATLEQIARMEAGITADRAEEAQTEAAYFQALEMIDAAATKVEGARQYWRQFAKDRNAISGLVYAMRDRGLTGESNAVVQWRIRRGL